MLTYETLIGSEIEDLINKNIYPKNKEELKVEEDDQGSALGSIGLNQNSSLALLRIYIRACNFYFNKISKEKKKKLSYN